MLLSIALAAQDHPAAFRDFALSNRTPEGSRVLQARIYYPGLAAGQDAALRPQAGGYPVYLFLHGMGSYGSAYKQVAEPLTRAGYVVVLADTALTDGALQYKDSIATLPSLAAENQDPQSFFHGALDLTRAGIGGYSMGGMTALRVLSTNCGYRVGFGHAAVAGRYYGPLEGVNCRQPFALVHGLGDTLEPIEGAYAWWQGGTNATGQRVLYVMNQECNHINVASVPALPDLPIFERTMRVCRGFLDAHLKGDATGLAEVLGAPARTEPRLVAIAAGVERPALLVERSGRAARITGIAEPGPLFLTASLARARVPTPFGEFLLDPAFLIPLATPIVDAGRAVFLELTLPEIQGLSGFPLPIQALGLSSAGAPRFTEAPALVF